MQALSSTPDGASLGKGDVVPRVRTGAFLKNGDRHPRSSNCVTCTDGTNCVVSGDDNVVGYSETTSFTDTSFRFGDSRTYTVAGYANGACIGDRSAAVTVTSDADGDGRLTVRDALACAAEAKRQGAAVGADDFAAMLGELAR